MPDLHSIAQAVALAGQKERDLQHIAQELTDACRAVPAPQDVTPAMIGDLRQRVDLHALRRLHDFTSRILFPTVIPNAAPVVPLRSGKPGAAA